MAHPDRLFYIDLIAQRTATAACIATTEAMIATAPEATAQTLRCIVKLDRASLPGIDAQIAKLAAEIGAA